jgi:hypothetical protein
MLPPFLLELLASCPQTGANVHQWLFCTARQLHAHLPPDEVAARLREGSAGCGRRVTEREIADAVRNSADRAWRPRKDSPPGTPPPPPPPAWPKLDAAKRREVIASEPRGLADFWEQSPRRFDDDESHAEEAIDTLFAPDCLLCCGATLESAETRPREAWRGQLSKLQFIVPSPMSALSGLTLDGKPSPRCLANTGPRVHLVVEFDSGTPDEQAALHWSLSNFMCLVAVVMSGGKSVHGWYRTAGRPAGHVAAFFRYAVRLGADRATWVACQLVRLPDGWRPDKRARQSLLFLAP